MIPVCEPKLTGNELKYVADCINTNWISSKGDYITRFEKGFAEFCGAAHGVSCTNGTAALHLALESLGIGRGDEVIIPDLSMVAVAYAVSYTGAVPVLIDAKKETWNIDEDKIEEKITKKTKAIIPVHTYGHPCEMDRITELAKKHNLYVIEDAAEAHGALYKNKKAGSLGDIACFSFYANKIITTGEGGMLVTKDKAIADKARYLMNMAFSKPRFLHQDRGFNYRMTNLQAAIGLAQLEKIDELMNNRIANAQLYNRLLKDTPGITLPPCLPHIRNVYWMYSVLIEEDFGLSRDKVMEKLSVDGIDTRNFFFPMHKQPFFKKLGIKFSGSYPVSEGLSRKGINLPSGSGLKKEDVKRVADAIKGLAKN